MKAVEYVILKYVHDQVTKEFVNLGVVVLGGDYLGCRVLKKTGRITHFFPDANSRLITSTLKGVASRVEDVAADLPDIVLGGSLERLITEILPKDDSVLQYSEVRRAFDPDPNAALTDLFQRYVTEYVHSELTSHDDRYVWTKVYKDYFDKAGITRKLTSHKVKTDHDEIEFERAWKNGHWRCFQPLSFDLKKDEAVKDKVYLWSAKLGELSKTNETVELALLTAGPLSEHKESLTGFIDEVLTANISKDSKLNVRIVKEDGAQGFVDELRRAVVQSEASSRK